MTPQSQTLHIIQLTVINVLNFVNKSVICNFCNNFLHFTEKHKVKHFCYEGDDIKKFFK